VSPQEIPALEEGLARSPEDGKLLLRYAAALYTAGRCDSALVVAARGRAIRPDDALGVLVVGQCYERDGQYDNALRAYRSFIGQYETARGIAAVRARELLATRTRATTLARSALARESELAQVPTDPEVVAVLPLTVSGDSSVLPLSRGLAQMMISDLALLRSFRMVERLELSAILDELQLAGNGRVDPSTAARVGHLVRAGRMVEGLADLRDRRAIRLEGGVILSDGQVTASDVFTGRFRGLLRLEKQLVVSIATRLGYQLSEAERQLILENGTQNLAAFLAYSRGLLAEEQGNYQLAAQEFSEAVRRDPSFQEARTHHDANAAAPTVQQATAQQITVVTSTVAAAPTVPQPVVAAVAGAVGDLAATTAEQTTETVAEAGTAGTASAVEHVTRQSSATRASAPPPPDVTPPPTVTATIRIVFRIP